MQRRLSQESDWQDFINLDFWTWANEVPSQPIHGLDTPRWLRLWLYRIWVQAKNLSQIQSSMVHSYCQGCWRQRMQTLVVYRKPFWPILQWLILSAEMAWSTVHHLLREVPHLLPFLFHVPQVHIDHVLDLYLNQETTQQSDQDSALTVSPHLCGICSQDRL
jgi:hypothetical protein